MTEGLHIDLSSIDAFRQRLVNAPKKIQDIVDAKLSDGADNIAAEAKQRAPGDVGFLRQGIGAERISFMSYRVFSRQLYSAYVEFGTRLNVRVPPGLEGYAAKFIGSPTSTILGAKEAIFAWCKRKGIEELAWYPIFITLMTKGAKPHPFFFPAVDRQLPIIKNIVIQVLTKDVFLND